MIVAFCGIDASGKATQSKLLAEALKAPLFSFPDYGSTSGRLIRAIFDRRVTMTQAGHVDLCPGVPEVGTPQAFALQAIMAANKYQVANLIAPLKGHPVLHVVLDRWTLCGEVYGAEDGVPEEWTRSINQALPEPDLWILLDISVEESFRRRPVRQDAYYETKADFLRAVRKRYVERFKGLPNFTSILVRDMTVQDAHISVLHAVDLTRDRLRLTS